MKHRIIIVLACVLALFLTACGQDEAKDTEPSPQVSANEVETTDDNGAGEYDLTKAMTIETEYITLSYPNEWESTMEYEVAGEDDSTVEFYAAVGSHEKVHIFDIQFGGDNGYCIGVVEKDGLELEINVVSYDVNFDETWAEEEINTVIAMQEDVNFIIQSLNAE